ncbi:MAG: 1-acyl-sn-glycerol-3-phosphate acyltransferase [Clostridia bacterium]|nr:1-acyl-sn-glycerol-3-phosphate acyltransferase [Clostridia bacterium]
MKQNEEKKKKPRKKVKKYKLFSFKYFIYDFVKITGFIPMWLIMRPKIIRLGEKKRFKGALIISNHIGAMDCVRIQFAFPFRRRWILAMKEVFEKPLSAFFFKNVNCIPVDRENVTIDTYHNVSDVLTSDKLLVLFPEGKINQDEKAEVQKFKGGAALFAIMNKVPVIPVYIVKKTKWYQREKMIVGEPIFLEDVCGGIPTLKDVNKVSEYLHDKEQELEAYYENNLKK